MPKPDLSNEEFSLELEHFSKSLKSKCLHEVKYVHTMAE